MTKIVAEGMNGEKYRMNGPYWVGRSAIKETVGGVYIILESPQSQYRFDFVCAGETDNLKNELCSNRAKRKWKNVAGGNYTYMAYLPTDEDTAEMDESETIAYRQHIVESIVTKYESETVRKQTVQQNPNAMNA